MILSSAPLLAMDGIRADTTVIDRTGDEKWLGDAYEFVRKDAPALGSVLGWVDAQKVR